MNHSKTIYYQDGLHEMKINNLTPYEIADAFPDECREYIPKILPVLKSKILKFREQVKAIEIMPINKDTKEFYLMFLGLIFPDTERKRISEYEKVMDILKNNATDKYISDKHAIVTAKARPIETLYSFQKVRQSSSRISAKCPFHDDNSPSFVIYRNTNTFYCFSGCGGGDAIDFFCKLNKVGFKEAVKELSQWSI